MTDRLSATDAAFLYAEDASTQMHVGGVVILDPAGADRPFDYQEIVDLVESRLSLVPRYRQKVRFVPGRLARPVWVDDDTFDITYHVRRSALPRPGTMEQLDDLIGRLISRPLDRSRPLWEVYVIEGLTGGRVALVNKTHHALVDRIGAVDVAAAILDLAPNRRRLPDQPWIPAPPPSDIDLVVDAMSDLVNRPSGTLDVVRLAALDVKSTIGRVGGLAGQVVDLVRTTVSPAPRSVLNVTKTSQRRFATTRAGLPELKAIRAAHGGSLNDVILAVLTGALRTWLLSHGEAVTATTQLRALVPVSQEPGEQAEEAGENSVTPSSPVRSYLLDLPVAEPNPVMRLHQVSFAMGAHLEAGRQMSADALLDLGRFAPPTLHALGARVAAQFSSRLYNVLVTNAPGPQQELYAAGWPVVAMYPVAPLAVGQALAVAVTSYNGGVHFGVAADRDAIPDIEQFAEHIGDAVSELLLPEISDVQPSAVTQQADPGPKEKT